MSDIYQEFLTRRSVRVYTDEPIADGDLKKILAAGLMAPTGKSKYPWQFIVVKDRAMLEKLSKCRIGVARMLAKAACAIVVVGDPADTDTLVEDCTIATAYMHLEASRRGLGRGDNHGRGRVAGDGGATADSV
ncbi:nitroreductase family protein, partial [Selenomonas sp.]|uniref:nitroreductase family protein n=1 Tax=Selenomonas sp. TaxID=2053611 RepID=UPI002A74D278